MAKFYLDEPDPQTGERIELTNPADITAARQAGKLAVDETGGVVVRTPEGARIQINEDVGNKLGEYLDAGYSLESDAEQQATERALMARSSPGTGFAEGLASGASFGLTDLAARQFAPELANDMAARRDALGAYGTAAEIAGGAIPAVFSGGSSLAARALAATPAGAAARLGASLGARAEAALLARGVGAGIARVGGLAAEGSLDGVLSGIGTELSEASLGDTELTAEQLIGSGAITGLLGLGLGGAIGAAGNKLRSIASRYDAVAPGSVADEVAPGLAVKPETQADAFKILPNWAKRGLAKRSNDPGLVSEVLQNPSLRADILNKSKVTDELNVEIRNSLDEAINTSHIMKDIGAGGVKVENLRQTIRTDTAQDALIAAQDEILTPWRQRLEAMQADELLTKADYKRYTKELDLVESRVRKGFSEADPASAYYALDRFKASFGKMTEAAANATGDVTALTKARLILDGAEQGRGNLQKFLEREDLFGTAAVNQRERNALWSKAIGSGRMFNDQLTSLTGDSVKDGHWWVKERYAQGDKVNGFLNKLVDPKNTTEVRMVRGHLQDMRDLYATIRKNGEIPDGKLELFERAEKGFDRALKALDDGETRLKKIGAFDALSKAEEEATGFAGRLPLLGAVLGGNLGAAAGTVAQGVMQPVGMTKKLMQLEAMMQHQLQTKALVNTKARGAVMRLAAPPTRRGSVATQIATRASTRLFGNDRQKARDRAKRIEQQLKQFRTNPEMLVTAMANQAGDFAESAPQTIMQSQLTAQRAIQFLDSKLPQPTKSNYLLQQQLNTTNWTDQDVDRFSHYAAAIAEPLSALDDLEAGRLEPATIEAVQAVYPKLYGDMRAAVTEQLAQQLEEVPHDAAVQISMMFGINGIPTLDTQFQATYQALQLDAKKKTQAPQRQPTGKPLTTGPVMAHSLADKLSQGLETP